MRPAWASAITSINSLRLPQYGMATEHSSGSCPKATGKVSPARPTIATAPFGVATCAASARVAPAPTRSRTSSAPSPQARVPLGLARSAAQPASEHAQQRQQPERAGGDHGDPGGRRLAAASAAAGPRQQRSWPPRPAQPAPGGPWSARSGRARRAGAHPSGSARISVVGGVLAGDQVQVFIQIQAVLNRTTTGRRRATSRGESVPL
jgi:hypothetical protein